MPRNGKQYPPLSEEEFPTLGGLLTKKELRNASDASEKATIDRLEQKAADERTVREVAKKEKAAKKAARQAANRLSSSTYHHEAIPDSPLLKAPDAAGIEPSPAKDKVDSLQGESSNIADVGPSTVDTEGLSQDNHRARRTTKAGVYNVVAKDSPRLAASDSAETGPSVKEGIPQDGAIVVKIAEGGPSAKDANGELPLDTTVATKITDEGSSTAATKQVSSHDSEIEVTEGIKEAMNVQDTILRQHGRQQHPHSSKITNTPEAESNIADREENIEPDMNKDPQPLVTPGNEESSEVPIKPKAYVIPALRKDYASPTSLGNPPRPSLQARAQTDLRTVKSGNASSRPALPTTQSHHNAAYTYDGASDDVRDQLKFEECTSSSSTPEQHKAMALYLGALVAEEDQGHQADWPITFSDPFLNRWVPLLAPLRTLRYQEARRAERPRKVWPVLEIEYQGRPVSMFGPRNSPFMPRTWKEFRSGGTWDMTPAYHGQEKVYANLFQRLAEEQR